MHFTWIAASFVAGCLLSAVYFGGLWWTVCRLAQSRRPWRLYFASYLVRLALLLVPLGILIALGNWQSWVAALIGFFLVRGVVVWRFGPARLPRPPANRVAL